MSRIERYFDLLIEFERGETKYHTSTHATKAEAMERLSSLRRFGISRALVWSGRDRVDLEGCVHLGSTIVHKEGRA